MTDQPMTTAGLQAKVALRRAWFETHPIAPAEDGGPAYESRRAEVEALFAAIEAEAATLAAPAGLLSEDALNGAYRERNALVAALVRVGGFDARMVPAPDTEAGWWIVYVETPAGQMSWHVADGDADLFRGIVKLPPDSAAWDGHTTPEKYRRLAALEAAPRSPETNHKIERLNHVIDVLVSASPETPEAVIDAPALARAMQVVSDAKTQWNGLDEYAALVAAEYRP